MRGILQEFDKVCSICFCSTWGCLSNTWSQIKRAIEETKSNYPNLGWDEEGMGLVASASDPLVLSQRQSEFLSLCYSPHLKTPDVWASEEPKEGDDLFEENGLVCFSQHSLLLS